MVDISNIVNIEKIRENKDQLREQRVKSAQLSGWEEVSKYIEGMEMSLEGMCCTNSKEAEFINGQAQALEMIKSFIASRVQLISPDHALARTNNMVVATM